MGILLVVLLVVAVAVAVWSVKRSGAPAPAVVGANLSGPGAFEFDIVGESHYQDVLEAICGGRKAENAEHVTEAVLILEDSNPHDNLAVRVDIDGDTVGYLSKSNARAYRRQLQELGRPNITCKCKAMIVGGWERPGGDVGSFGVNLDLPVT